jgi:hypothetical protein
MPPLPRLKVMLNFFLPGLAGLLPKFSAWPRWKGQSCAVSAERL